MRPQPNPQRSGSFGRGFLSPPIKGPEEWCKPRAPRTEPWQPDDLVTFEHFQSHNYTFPGAIATKILAIWQHLE